jgi:hypothetical protein
MSAANNETTFVRAGQIIADSRVAALVDRVCSRSLAIALASRSFAVAQRRVLTVRHMSPSERAGCLVIIIATAVAGHVAVASMLPTAGRPTVWLTALLLVAGGLAGAAAGLAGVSDRVRRARRR